MAQGSAAGGLLLGLLKWWCTQVQNLGPDKINHAGLGGWLAVRKGRGRAGSRGVGPDEASSLEGGSCSGIGTQLGGSRGLGKRAWP